MKYVKIFDSQMRPLGVLQLGAELAQSEETKYVKVYDENLDKCNGVVALSDNISEADAAKRIKIYDANLILIGGSTVGEIVDNRETAYLEINAKEAVLNEPVNITVYSPYDATGNIELYIDNETQPSTKRIKDGRAEFTIEGFATAGDHTIHAHYDGDEQFRPADEYATITVTEE